MTNPQHTTRALAEIGPYPSAGTVTAENLARYETVGAFAWDVEIRRHMSRPASDASRAEQRRYMDALTVFCSRFAVAFLLWKIREVAPDDADEIAEQLHDLWEDGGSMPEFLWDWLAGDGIDPREVQRAVASALAAKAAA